MKDLNEQKTDDKLNSFTEKARKVFGTDENSLLAEWNAGEREWERMQSEEPEAAEKLRSKADAGFDALMRKIQEMEADKNTNAGDVGKETEALADYEEESDTEPETADLEWELEQSAIELQDAEREILRGNKSNENSGQSADKISAKTHLEAAGNGTDTQEAAIPISGRRKGRLRGRKKVLLVAVAVCVMAFGMTMAATGAGRFGLRQYEMTSEQSKVMSRNAELSVIRVNKVDDAYERIGKDLDIPVLILDEVPEKMRFKRFILNNDCAIIEFVYHEKSIYFQEAKMLNEAGESIMIVSDRKLCQEVNNIWLNKTIQIEENILEDGMAEYSARIEMDTSYYYLSGIMEKEEFVRLVENINEY